MTETCENRIVAMQRSDKFGIDYSVWRCSTRPSNTEPFKFLI